MRSSFRHNVPRHRQHSFSGPSELVGVAVARALTTTHMLCWLSIVVPPALTNTNEKLIVCGVDAISSIPKEGGATFCAWAAMYASRYF